MLRDQFTAHLLNLLNDEVLVQEIKQDGIRLLASLLQD